LSGSITGATTELSTVLPQVGGGKIRVLGVAWGMRSPNVPDVPTMIEQGVKDFTAASYVGILAPAATPAEIVKTLEAALVKALSMKETQERFLKTGAELVPDDLMTSKGFGDYIRKEFDLTREAAKLAGLTPT
jgi:tripartite-type tricarboxylate transporter receptor subunit TctC